MINDLYLMLFGVLPVVGVLAWTAQRMLKMVLEARYGKQEELQQLRERLQYLEAKNSEEQTRLENLETLMLELEPEVLNVLLGQSESRDAQNRHQRLEDLAKKLNQKAAGSLNADLDRATEGLLKRLEKYLK